MESERVSGWKWRGVGEVEREVCLERWDAGRTGRRRGDGICVLCTIIIVDYGYFLRYLGLWVGYF